MSGASYKELPGAADRALFTPGPLTTSRTVKQAMLRDLGSRDIAFIEMVREIRQELLAIGGVSRETGYEAVLMQGSGTFGVESVISSVIPPDGTLLVMINGAYGERIAKMAAVHHIPTRIHRDPENAKTSLTALEQELREHPEITHVAIVHCETTTGILNPMEEAVRIACSAGKITIVDAMSSFGAIPVDLAAVGIDYLISSANKCIEGVPGFSFVLADRSRLLATEGFARTLSLDLLAQWKGLEANGQFRFTPPTHALLAFSQALQELKQEGGAAGRGARYHQNHETLVEGMRSMGFQEYVRPEDQTDIITTFLYPKSLAFDFESFYDQLNARGCVIYPGKLTQADCFRIGSIGRLFPADMKALLSAIRETLCELGVQVPVT